MKILRYFYISLVLVLGLSPGLLAQITDPAQWTSTSSKSTVKIGEELTLIFDVKLDDNWYVYSSDLEEGGPLPSVFAFEENDSYTLVGDIQPVGDVITKYEELFEMDVRYFKKKAQFKQKVKILKKDFSIAVSYSGQVCLDDESGKCIPIKEDFSFDNSNITVTAAASVPVTPQQDTDVEREKEVKEETDPEATVEEKELDDTPEVMEEETETEPESATAATTEDEVFPDDDEVEEASGADSQGLFLFALNAFLWGFFALLTPCVFPMIPMTVTFFTKQSKTRSEGISKAVFYGVSIIAIYTILGVIVSSIFGPSFNNWLSTHWIPNLFFFLLLVVFGLSFLGMFEIVLPSSLVNQADQQADKGGYYGIVFMAFTLALVSFSCTAPIVGTVLIQSFEGEFVRPIVGMLAFSTALALPFTLFAIFPSWLNTLPKSGGWLNSVKVVLGFLELALSLKFLSVADQVYHWGILDRDVYLALWIVIFGMIGFYLLGKIRLPHDSPVEKIGVPRAVLAILSLSFVVYMVPGMFGAPLKPLAGYLPPRTTLDFQGGASYYAANVSSSEKLNAKYADFLDLPHNLNGFFDYNEGLAYAQQVQKPIFIDFTGHGCVNCREMEERVWSDPQVLKRLQEDYVVIALYVDDRKLLPENEWYTSPYDKKTKKTLGDQNFDFQITKFNSNAQPYYCLLDGEGNLLVKPKEYDLKVDNFVKFLDKGVTRFKKKQVLAKN